MKTSKTIVAGRCSCTTLIAALLLGSLGPWYTTAHAEIDLATLDKVRPMEFFVARGASNACGEGCDTWIAAEGRFDEATPARFRRLLEQIGDSNLPVFFSSPGGELYPALELGHVLREHSMRVGVGIALPRSCMTTGNLEECIKLMHSNSNLQAMLWSNDVLCASACTFALLGAVRREVASEAYLGIHPTTLDTRKLQLPPDEQLRRVNAYLQRADKFIPAYFSEMGIESGLYDIVKQTKLEQMHVLTRSELYRLGIDRRERIESNWIAAHLEFSANGEAALKYITTTVSSIDYQFEHLALAISCDYQPNRYVLSALRYFPDTTLTGAIDITLGTGTTPINLYARDAFTASYTGTSIEVRQSKLSEDALEKLLGASTIDIIERPVSTDLTPPDKTEIARANKFSVSTVGAGDAFKAIAASCPIAKAP